LGGAYIGKPGITGITPDRREPFRGRDQLGAGEDAGGKPVKLAQRHRQLVLGYGRQKLGQPIKLIIRTAHNPCPPIPALLMG
jgi:hypothetical protein